MDANREQTPEFLCWAIERQCPLREMLPENQPEKVERQLRAARYTAEAIAEGRVENDLAVSADRKLAFRVSDSLAIFGGEAAVRECCGNCPANALAAIRQPSYAGCYGLCSRYPNRGSVSFSGRKSAHAIINSSRPRSSSGMAGGCARR